ncbi:helix-turn-helix domain-containing protein [uncultured Fibrella sp.]|uniref:helix-turn-helix domain-containing protein n=1 Tax=uncultured Fibrella sp. TaxID=1284596 RepID=UPI0035C9B89E
MEVICLQDDAFYTLIDKVVERIQQQQKVREDKWISGSEAMQRLRIQSKTTLQKLRDEGSIRFTQPEKKIILYDTDSIEAYLNRHAKSTF